MADRKSSFTARFLDSIKPGPHVRRLYDGMADPELKGFGVAVATSGALTFFLSFTSPKDGQRKFYPCGKFIGADSLSQARQKARETRRQINAGIDPVLIHTERKRATEREAQTEKTAAGLKFRDLLDAYVALMRKEGKPSADEVERSFDVDVKPYPWTSAALKAKGRLAPPRDAEFLGDKPAGKVTDGDVLDVLGAVADRSPRMARDLRGALKRAFQAAVSSHRNAALRSQFARFAVHVNPVASTDPITAPSNPGERALTIDEIRLLWNASPELLAPRIALAMKFMLATGQRSLEVIEMPMSELDSENRMWVIAAGRRKSRWKQRYDHVVPLEPLHLDLIEEACSVGDGGPYVFAGLSEGEPMKPEYVGDVLARCAKVLKIPHFTPRDLRRTWKTLAGRYGIDLELRNRIQGHAMNDVGSRHYDRHDYLEEKRAAM